MGWLSDEWRTSTNDPYKYAKKAFKNQSPLPLIKEK